MFKLMQNHLCLLAQKLVDEGVPTETILKEIEWVKKTQKFFGISSKLDFLIYGGRLKGAKAFMGKLLQICPRGAVFQAFPKALFHALRPNTIAY